MASDIPRFGPIVPHPTDPTKLLAPGLRAILQAAQDELSDAIYMDTERGPIEMSERKSSNPKDILSQGEQRVLLHLIPTPALIETARAMMDGAKKYGPYNWREEGVGASTYLSASMRHIRSYLDGERDAADSKVHHLGHAIACLAILLDAEAVGNLVDDRPLPAPSANLMDALKHSSTETDREVTRQNASLMLHDVVTQEESEAAYRGRMAAMGFPQPKHTGRHRPEKYMGPAAEDIHVSEPEFSEDPMLSELGIGKVPEDPVPPDEQNPGGCC